MQNNITGGGGGGEWLEKIFAKHTDMPGWPKLVENEQASAVLLKIYTEPIDRMTSPSYAGGQPGDSL